jgi:hypothetical protein
MNAVLQAGPPPSREEIPVEKVEGSNRLNHRASKHRWGLLVIAFAFLVTSALTFVRGAPYFEVGCIEEIQIRKMLDYGFINRRGITLGPDETSGRVAHPDKFNYVHHPMFRTWPHVLIHRFSGATGVVVFDGVLTLLTCFLIYAVLERQFGNRPALIASTLCTCAPATTYWGLSTTPIFPSLLFWPATALLIWRARREPSFRLKHCFWVGLLVFAAGQFSWFSLGTIPTLLLMSALPGAGWKDTVRRNLRNPMWRAIIVGGTLTALFFGAQVLLFDPSVRELIKYTWGLVGKAPVEKHTGLSRGRLLLLFLVHAVLLLGPALIAGLLLSLWVAIRSKRLDGGTRGMIVFVGLNIGGMLAVPYFYDFERWPIAWMLFPATYLTAAWLSTVRTRTVAVTWSLIVLAIPGFLYLQVMALLPNVSSGGKILTSYLTQHTRPEDLVLMDFKYKAPPFKPWENIGIDRLADRLAFYDIDSSKQLDKYVHKYGNEVSRVLYLHESHCPMDDDVAQKVRAGTLLDRTELTIPIEEQQGERLFHFLNGWRRALGPKVPETGDAGQNITLELYRLE